MLMKKAAAGNTDGDPEHRTLRHTTLLGVLLGLILIGPFFGARLNTAIFLGAMAVVAALLDREARRTRAAIAIMALPAIILFVVQFLPPGSRRRTILQDDWLTYIIQVLVLIALGYGGWLILKSLLQARSVSVNEIFGAISLYLIIAFIWSFSYDILERAHPGSFKLIDLTEETDKLADVQADTPADMEAVVQAVEEEVQPMMFLYFSMVTQSSLGYGDITPKSIMAQRLVVLQVVMGQFYMAIVVAYLISLFMLKRRE